MAIKDAHICAAMEGAAAVDTAAPAARAYGAPRSPYARLSAAAKVQ
jgi:hypothetical protein